MNTLLRSTRRRAVHSRGANCACVRAYVCSNGAFIEGRMNDDAPTAKAHPDPMPQSSFYPRTNWSIVFTAGKDSSPDARAALGELYVAYLPPLLAYLRSKGHPHDGAMDRLHAFFEHLLETNGLSTVEKRGKLRNWLLRAMNNFLTDEWREAHALKRGGGKTHLPIGPDFEAGEIEPAGTGLTPEQAFDRKWAIALLKRVLTRLQGEYTQAGKQILFAELKNFLPGGHTACSHQEIADRLEMKVNTVAVNIMRLRERYGELLRAEIADTTDSDMVEEEWRHLQAALGGRPETASGDSKA